MRRLKFYSNGRNRHGPIFKKVVMGTYKSTIYAKEEKHKEEKHTKLKRDFFADRKWQFPLTRIYFSKEGSYFDSDGYDRIRGTYTIKGNNIILKPHTTIKGNRIIPNGELRTLTFLEGRSTEGLSLRYMDLKDSKTGEEITVPTSDM